MDEILGRQSWVAPRATVSSTQGPSISAGAIESTHNGRKEPTRKRKRPEEVLEDLYNSMKDDREMARKEARIRADEKERKKQDRHEEKMALMRQFLELMARMIPIEENGN